jgi:hypothetical protein
LAVGLVLAALALATPARAQAEPTAAAAYRAGEDAYRRGAFVESARSFETAFRRDPRGASIYNAALAWQAAHDMPRAADDYAAALETTDLPPSFASDAHARLSALEQTLGRIDVTAPAGARVTVAQAAGLTCPARVHVTPGTYAVRVVYANARRQTKSVAASSGEPVSVVFEQPPEEPVPPAAEPRSEAPPSSPSSPPSASSPSSSSTSSPVLGWVALGSGAALGIVGAVLYFDAKSARDDYVAGGDTDVGLHDRAKNLLVASWIAAGVGVAAAATGVVLLLSRGPSDAAGSARAELHVTPAGAWLSGSFE